MTSSEFSEHEEPISDDHSITSDQEEADEQSTEPLYELTILLHNQPLQIPIHHENATIQDLSDIIATDLSIPASNQKLLITPKTGLLKPPFKDPTIPLTTLRDKKIVLMGATTTEVADLTTHLSNLQTRLAHRAAVLKSTSRTPTRTHDSRRAIADAKYTFHTLRPLPHLPHPDKSLRYLTRLRDDAGIRASMRKHQFSVGLLTEMDPAEHTTHESRTLGLNRNRGEVIELRLRTDAYDGYRDYKTIRKTLCHELAHNVWGEHDARFWKLCKEIEAEVERGDWRSGGRSVGGEEFYNPEDEGVGESVCGGAWEGGEYVLGGGGTGSAAGGDGALTRREIMARAAEERLRKQQEARRLEREANDTAE